MTSASVPYKARDGKDDALSPIEVVWVIAVVPDNWPANNVPELQSETIMFQIL